jgi:hypothetical protein
MPGRDPEPPRVVEADFSLNTTTAGSGQDRSGLEKAIAALSQMPQRHPIAEDETEQPGITLRQMLQDRRFGVFRILFSVEGDTVTLHFIHHSAQGPIEP